MSDRQESGGGRSEGSEPTNEERRHASNERDELRTISFRLREIQRLLGARVKQENRRLEAEGVEPVTDHGFFHPDAETERAEDRGPGDDRE